MLHQLKLNTLAPDSKFLPLSESYRILVNGPPVLERIIWMKADADKSQTISKYSSSCQASEYRPCFNFFSKIKKSKKVYSIWKVVVAVFLYSTNRQIEHII